MKPKCVFECRGCISKTLDGYCIVLRDSVSHNDIVNCPFKKDYKTERNELLYCYERIKNYKGFTSFKDYLNYLDNNSHTIYFIRFLEEVKDATN